MAGGTYVVERSTSVEAPPERVYALVADFRQWPRWSPWEGLDPGMERTYSGADAGPGAAYAWSGNRKAGRGRMTVVRATPPREVAIDLEFEKPWRSRSDTVFTVVPESTGSRVTWTMTGTQTGLGRVMAAVVPMDRLLGGDFEKVLAQLKAAAEADETG